MRYISYFKLSTQGSKSNTYLVAGDERASESKSTGDTRCDFLGRQLKQTNSNNYVHASFDESE